MVVKFLVLGDLHGEKPKFLIDDFDAIIATGDICSDDIVKYIRIWLKKRNEDLDYDFYKVCPKWKEYILSKKSLWKGRKVLKYLNQIGKPVFLVPGNWDQTDYLDGIGSNVSSKKSRKNNWIKIKKNLKNIKDVEFKKINFKGIDIIGHGSVSAPEIMNKPIKNFFDDLEEYDEQLTRYKHFKKVNNKLTRFIQSSKKPILLLSHNVPNKTKLDKINSPGNYAHNKHYGSILIRKLIDKFQPMICIGGHIHEGYGKTRLRKTVCINAGFGGKVNTIISIDEKKGKVLNVEFLGENKI